MSTQRTLLALPNIQKNLDEEKYESSDSLPKEIE